MVVLVVLIVLIWCIPYLYSNFSKPDEEEMMEIQMEFLEFEKELEKHEKSVKTSTSFQKFYFDPNTISQDSLELLGFPTWLAKRLEKFRSSGGKFFKKSDLKKIYGLDDGQYSELEPWIQITNRESDHKETDRVEFERTPAVIDVNLADSIDLLDLKGIGPVYASRIVRYRKLLGGFVSLEQLREVYGISDSLFNELKPNVTLTLDDFRKININSIELDELKKHPYFRNYNLCRGILEYRKQHGGFSSVEDLEKIHLVTPELMDKISPYLSFE